LNIVLDSNILFSALIKDSLTRKMIILHTEILLFPSVIFDEMEKHKGELLRKSEMNIEQFETLLEILLHNVQIIPTDILRPYKKKAYDLVKDIDPDDALIIACALAYPRSILWSDDKKLKQQSIVTVVNTTEMYQLFYGAL